MGSLRARLGRLRRAAGYRDLIMATARTKRPVIAYIGWTGEDNLGDEGMFAAHRAAFDFDMRLVPVPIVEANPVLQLLGPRVQGVCLGGGTLIGNGYFRRGLESAMRAAPNARRFMLGTGAESLDYRLGNRTRIDDEFARWPSLLGEFDEVRVRGPLSVDTLSRLGVAARATGDPAVLLPHLQVPKVPGLIGINVGITDDQWGGDGASPSALLEQLIGQCRAAGFTPRLVPTTAPDYYFAKNLLRTSSWSAELPPRPLSVTETLKWVGACEAFVGVKLHSLILAATQSVPVVALEYRPKCRDFMQSIGRDAFSHRIDAFDAARTVELLAASIADTGQTTAMTDQLLAQQQMLRDAIGVEIASLV